MSLDVFALILLGIFTASSCVNTWLTARLKRLERARNELLTIRFNRLEAQLDGLEHFIQKCPPRPVLVPIPRGPYRS